MKMDYKEVIYLITIGLTMGFGLVVYAHANFTTKEAVIRLEEMQEYKNERILRKLDKIEAKLDSLIK